MAGTRRGRRIRNAALICSGHVRFEHAPEVWQSATPLPAGAAAISLRHSRACGAACGAMSATRRAGLSSGTSSGTDVTLQTGTWRPELHSRAKRSNWNTPAPLPKRTQPIHTRWIGCVFFGVTTDFLLPENTRAGKAPRILLSGFRPEKERGKRH